MGLKFGRDGQRGRGGGERRTGSAKEGQSQQAAR